MRPADRTSASEAARPSCATSSPRAWSTTCTWSRCRSCSVVASGYGTDWRRLTRTTRSRPSPRPPASPTSPSTGRPLEGVCRNLRLRHGAHPGGVADAHPTTGKPSLPCHETLFLLRETREPLPRHVFMPFCAPPVSAAWHHRDARAGFEVAFVHPVGGGYRVEGTTTAVEDGEAWIVGYSLRLDAGWAARSAHVVGRSAGGVREVSLERDGAGRWEINGTAVPAFDGCVDVDLESSALTNAFPVRRLGLDIGRRGGGAGGDGGARDPGGERARQRLGPPCARGGGPAPKPPP